jgi:uncharacterized protein DUF3563
MNSKTLWDEHLGMLMACGSPGSALAYHLGQTTFQPMMVRRNTATADAEADCRRVRVARADVEAREGPIARVRNWFQSAFARLEMWSWQRQMREREAYLAQAIDLADLEARMRDLDGDPFLSRARALR